MLESLFSVCKEHPILFLLTLIITYLIGGINSSLVVTKLLKTKEDIRNLGSGNAGFTNALRTMGKKIAILTFIGDFVKGVLAVWLGIKIASWCSMSQDYLVFAHSAALMCVIGHIYPCFFGFRGGKGILTAWATSLLIDWRIFVILISVFLIVFIFSKIISLASIFAAFAYPTSLFLISKFDSKNIFEIMFPMICVFIMASLVIFKHRSNISRILNGTEKKISINKVS